METWGLTLHFYAGLRHEQIELNNTDMIKPAQSYDAWRGFESPKATVTWTPWDRTSALAAFQHRSVSGRHSLHRIPRISAAEGSTPGAAALTSPFERSHSEQLVLEKEVGRTDVRVTLGRTTTTATLAKIDPDDGLADDEGPRRSQLSHCQRAASVQLRHDTDDLLEGRCS